MALTKSYQEALASTTNTAGSTTDGSWFAVGYGVTGVAKITNGGTGPTLPCVAYLQVATDNSGSNSAIFATLGSPGVGNSASADLPFAIGIGAGADAVYYRLRFTGNTGQSVTVQGDAWSTTAL